MNPELLEAASEHILTTALAFRMEGHITTEQDGNPNEQ